ncbi:MAG: DUF6515 family protein [Syntrophales bacterium]
MKVFLKCITWITSGLIIAVLSGFLWFGFPQASYAQHDDRHGEKQHGNGNFMDSRYGHNHYYPSHGNFVTALPKNHHVVVYGDERYYFHGGIWYRPSGLRFSIIVPPIGVVVSFLPPYYTSIWVKGYPYYYADEVYYAPAVGGYMVVAPPQGTVSRIPPPASSAPSVERLFIYPRKGQSEQQQADDRYQCHRWAVNQTNYDPTQPPAGNPSAQKNADYQRAMGACLDARGYTVK